MDGDRHENMMIHMRTGGGASCYKQHWHAAHLKHLKFFVKNHLCLSFFLVEANFFLCSFAICLTLALTWFLISALSLRYLCTSCNALWNSIDEMPPHCIAWEMIRFVLCNLLWAISGFIASCFSCFTVNILKDFHVMAVSRERSILVPLKAIPKGRPTSLANAAL